MPQPAATPPAQPPKPAGQSSRKTERWPMLVPTLSGIALVASALAFALGGRVTRPERLTYSEFKRAVAAGRIKAVELSHDAVRGELLPTGTGPANRFEADRVEDPRLLELLESKQVEVRGVPDARWLEHLLGLLAPLALPLLLLYLMGRRLVNGASSPLPVGQSHARVYLEKDIPVRFADVAGIDEAKAELQEVVEFLRKPEKYARLGGHIPKGVLLVGPPGTGKTLLAKAVAGEAGVPFFNISGSEFVELFVGVGAARVRDLFTQAKQQAPCIIFIDELDALGKARNAGPMAHEEREQTLNQLLVEMDGFDPRSGVLLMAATNRPEILDPALLRAGRFDRHVVVDRPDKAGRIAILRLHAAKVKLSSDVDWDALAAMTAGMAGADLANVINEAALLASRRGKEAVGRADLTEAVERVVTGLEKRSRVLRPQERERVAHHEVGHALIGLALPGLGVVQKISIIPRGVSSLGFTLQVPTEDHFLLTRSEIENRIAQLMGGRTAEELVFGEESTGAADDLQKATALATRMVSEFGMSPAVGVVSLSGESRPGLLEGDESQPHGPALRQFVDVEVRRILDEQHQRARRLLQEREQLLRTAARVLQLQETLSGEELAHLASSTAH